MPVFFQGKKIMFW